MTHDLDKFLMNKGHITIDDLLGVCLVAWISGIGAAFLGGILIGIFNHTMMYALIAVFFSIFAIPMGMLIAIPLIFIIQASQVLNGLIVIIIGLLCSFILAVPLFGSGLNSFSLLVAFVGVSTGAAAWHAGARYYDDVI